MENENRFIYYLVTKKYSTGKPRYEELESSLKEMKEHCERNEVKKLAMPRIGCGLDRLEWSRVKPMMEEIFADVDISITVYNYNSVRLCFTILMKNMLKRRKESNTYLATFRRHRWSAQMSAL